MNGEKGVPHLVKRGGGRKQPSLRGKTEKIENISLERFLSHRLYSKMGDGRAGLRV